MLFGLQEKTSVVSALLAVISYQMRMGLGNNTWVHLSAMEEEIDPKPFYKAVRSFYPAILKKMLKFPFGDSILKDLGIINPDNVCNYSFSTVPPARSSRDSG